MVESEGFSCRSSGTSSVPGIRLVVMGASGSGKTSLIRRYCEKRFVASTPPTLGVDYAATKICVESKEMHVHFFDTSGAAIFEEVRNEFYVDIDGLLLVIDLTSKASLRHLDSMVNEIESKRKQHVANNLSVAIAANKSDDAGRREVQVDAIDEWCRLRHLDSQWVTETSARSGRNVSEVFHLIFHDIIERNRNTHPETPKAKGSEQNETKRRSESTKRDHHHHRTRTSKGERTTRLPTATTSVPTTTATTTATAMRTTVTSTPTTTTPAAASTTTTSTTTAPTSEQLRVMQRLVQGEYMGDPWYQLGLSKRCTKEEVNKAYRKLAALLHPDKNKTEGADEAFKTLAKARRRIVDALARFEAK